VATLFGVTTRLEFGVFGQMPPKTGLTARPYRPHHPICFSPQNYHSQSVDSALRASPFACLSPFQKKPQPKCQLSHCSSVANIQAPSFSTGYRLVTRVLHTHIFLVNHILIECPQFNHLRQQYHFVSTLKELFNNTSVNDIIAFIKDTHFCTCI